MNILVLNGSPKARYSVTLQTVLYLEKLFPKQHFDYLHVGGQIKLLERDFTPAMEALSKADLLLFSYPVYTFIAPSQLHRFLELVKASGIDLSGKFATQVTTSKHFYDVTAHRYIQDNCQDLGLKFIKGLSADMDDLLTEQGQRDARKFFSYVLWCVKQDSYEPLPDPRPAFSPVPATLPAGAWQASGKTGAGQASDATGAGQTTLPGSAGQASGKTGAGQASDTVGAGQASDTVGAGQASGKAGFVAIVTDCEPDNEALRGMIDRFRAVLPYESQVVNIRQYPFQGGCLGCFHCATDGVCVYTDGFDDYLRNRIQTAAAIVYAFTIKDHSMGAVFKRYDDRQFCNGHRTVTMGMPMGYLVDGPYSAEPNLQMIVEGRAEVGGNFLAGVATNEADPDKAIDRMAATLTYAIKRHYTQPQNFYGVGGMKIFRDLIFLMQGMMKADHQFYKQHGQYDFPQKKPGTVLKMYLVGGLLSSPKLKAKIGNNMNEGMLMPYRKVLQAAEKQAAVKNPN